MNLSEITCIALGMIFNVFTFVLGVAVGVNVSQKRKDSTDGNRYEDEGFKYYPDDAEGNAATRSSVSGPGRGKALSRPSPS
jgi:hypothetical protein